MAAPTVYTEASLAEFMHVELGRIGATLKYDPAFSYTEAVNETLLAYGTNDIASASNIQKLRALARVEAWKKAAGDLAAMYKFSADGGSFERQQMFDQAQAKLKSAETAALAYSPDYQVVTTRLRPVNDPYRYTDIDEQTP